MYGRPPAAPAGWRLLTSAAGLDFLKAYRPTRLHVGIAAGAILLLAIVVVAGVTYSSSPVAGVHARLDVKNAEHVHVNEPVEVRFDQPVNLARATATIDLDTPVHVTRQSRALILTPDQGWAPGKRYTLALAGVRDLQKQPVLQGWRATYTIQPRVGIAAVLVDGRPADPARAAITSRSKVAVSFTVPMRTSTVTITRDGTPLPASQLQWAPDGQSVTLAGLGGGTPYVPVALAIVQGAYSAQNDPMTDGAATATVTPQALLPSNQSSGIDANYKPSPPFMVVIENSGDARPQAGLQAADMVYEYVSEYSISRMTAIYFNKPPGLIGPVRSCRMINPFLGYAYGGYTMCSGASVGTLHYMFLDPYLVPGTINDFDQGSHFYRVGFRAAPHNLYTDGDRALTLRSQWSLPPPSYTVDPPHDDLDMGQPADAPSVPLHYTQWQYDGASRQYLRFDHGGPFIDDLTHQQLHAKNVVLLHVGSHDAGWVEDDNGGAHSVWYDMLGSGPAEVWSNGKVVHATWHMGQGGAQWYYDNHQPVWFTDEAGHVLELNSGLTWLHVIGSGQ